eukprot:gene18956-biopygen14522
MGWTVCAAQVLCEGVCGVHGTRKLRNVCPRRPAGQAKTGRTGRAGPAGGLSGGPGLSKQPGSPPRRYAVDRVHLANQGRWVHPLPPAPAGPAGVAGPAGRRPPTAIS